MGIDNDIYVEKEELLKRIILSTCKLIAKL